MMIPVKYNDGRHDLVKPQILERLLSTHKLVGFKRSSGWVTVGVDPIRKRERRLYSRQVEQSDRRAEQH